MAILVEDVEVITRDKPRMSFTAYQGRGRWRNYNRPPRINIRSEDVALTEATAAKLAEAIRIPVLTALGRQVSDAILVLNPTGGDDHEPVLELKRSEDEAHFPRADLFVFVYED